MKKIVALLLIGVLCFVYADMQAQTPSLILKSEKRIGERPIIRVTAYTTPIQIDWGDGTKRSYVVSTTWGTTTAIGFDLLIDNPTIKVYGQFLSIIATDMGLWSLEFQGNQWNRLRRLDCQNNLLTSLIFPATAGFTTGLGTIFAYNNKFDVCAVEGIYSSLVDKSSTAITGSLTLTGNGSATVEGEGNALQNEAVKLYSKISLANARKWNVLDSKLTSPNNIISESPTAPGCNIVTLSDISNGSGIPDCPTCHIVVNNGAHLTVDVDKTYNKVTVNAGGKLTLANGKTLTAPITIIGDATNGSGTYLDENTGIGLPAITATVKQWLPAASTRTWWYLASPVIGAPYYVLSPNLVGDYSETTRSYSNPFTTPIPNPPITLEASKGFAVKMTATAATNYEIRDKSLNNGDISLSLTRTINGTSDNMRGFNLVGNPYPSYIDWDLVHVDATNLRNAIWFRTMGETEMTYHTYGDGEAVPITANVSGMIAPMQGFWVKVDADPISPETVSTGMLNFKNTHRKHFETRANLLKVKTVETRPRLRLVVSNGTATDEMLIVGKSYASDELDSYDIEKMSNENAAIPEIYSVVNSQELVINSMNELTEGKSVTLGFRPGQAGTFNIETTQLDNIDTKVLLRDKVAGTEQELIAGTPYKFTSDGTLTNERFLISLVSRISTGVEKDAVNSNLSVYRNRNNRIEVIYNGKINKSTVVSVYNVAGQKLNTQSLVKAATELIGNFDSGVYLIQFSDGTRIITHKLIIH